MSESAVSNWPLLKKSRKIKIKNHSAQEQILTWAFYDSYEIEHSDLNGLASFQYCPDADCAE